MVQNMHFETKPKSLHFQFPKIPYVTKIQKCPKCHIYLILRKLSMHFNTFNFWNGCENVIHHCWLCFAHAQAYRLNTQCIWCSHFYKYMIMAYFSGTCTTSASEPQAICNFLLKRAFFSASYINVHLFALKGNAKNPFISIKVKIAESTHSSLIKIFIFEKHFRFLRLNSSHCKIFTFSGFQISAVA